MKTLILTSLIMSLTSTAMAQQAPASLQASKTIESRLQSQLQSGGGVINGGGGNSINGQLLENYQQSTDELEVASLVNAKLKVLERDIRRFSKDLQERAKETKWYIVPVSIDELPPEITGIGVRTDQDAVQIQKEVYVDQKRWKKMSAKQKTDLVLHELVLAQYLVLKSTPSLYYPGIRDALAMSDMRRISKLVKDYTSADMALLGQELSERNYGSYLTLAEKTEIETKAKHTLKWTYENYCIGTKPLLNNLARFILMEFYMNYRYGYDLQLLQGSPYRYLHGQRASQRDQTLSDGFRFAWLHLAEVFPKELILLRMPELSDMFEYVYPRQTGSAADAKAGQEACEKLKKYDINNRIFVNY